MNNAHHSRIFIEKLGETQSFQNNNDFFTHRRMYMETAKIQ